MAELISYDHTDYNNGTRDCFTYVLMTPMWVLSVTRVRISARLESLTLGDELDRSAFERERNAIRQETMQDKNWSS